jgi:hypothetical protein
VRANGRRDFQRLVGLLEVPLELLGTPPRLPVYHVTIRAAPGDRDLTDREWGLIAAEVMHRTGLSEPGRELDGVPWVAVRHAADHIHIAAILVQQDGRRAHLHNDYYRIAEAVAWAEREYGLRLVAQADRTAARRPTRAEHEKARQAGQADLPRDILRRKVMAAAAAASTEAEFFGGLARRGAAVWLRQDPERPGEPTGYAVSLPADVTASGRPVWYGGSKLAADLSLPKLRHRWDGMAPRLAATAGPVVPAGASEIYKHATAVATQAAREIAAGRPGWTDTAWAAADLLTVAAESTGNPEMLKAADGFARAARPPWGRLPERSPSGMMLRAAARMAASLGPSDGHTEALRRLLMALAGLADALAELRTAQQRLLQARAAREAATRFADAAGSRLNLETSPVSAGVADLGFTGQPGGQRRQVPARRTRPTPSRSPVRQVNGSIPRH